MIAVKMGLEKLLKDAQIIAIICFQWGDTGKGKFSDYFASQWADVTARGTGGNNAGHTVVINGKEKIYHLIPAGIINDSNGHITVLGNGMVIDLPTLVNELDDLDSEGMSYDNLMISKDAHVTLPYHIDFDVSKNKSQSKGGIGSTGRGIGPTYTDKVARTGIMIEHLFNRDRLARKIDRALEFYPDHKASRDEIIDSLNPYAERIHPFVRDTGSEMHGFVRQGKKISLEGAQGLLLSIEHGTDPYVTSSDCSLNGTASGVGLSAKMVDLPLVIIKFPFMTRVGAGPFPTEFGGRNSEDYCAENGHTDIEELEHYDIPHQVIDGKVRYDKKDLKILEMINSKEEFIQGIGIRLAAWEYGATTGRPRRTGWIDGVAAKYAVGINGPLLILTKPDSLSGAKEFKIAYGYKVGDDMVDTFSRNEEVLRSTNPQYKSYEGYGNISGIRDYDKLPSSLRKGIEDLESFTRGRVAVVSVGADREETIVR